jgi:dihydrofolate reductase
MYETPKVVFSKTMQDHDWQHTELVNGDLAEEVARLKQQAGGDIVVYGGGNFVSNLIKEVLIDEYHFFVNPSMLGTGMPIFQDLEARRALKLVHSRSFECGIVVLCYEQA